MIAKNVHKSSEFLFIAPEYLKLKKSRESAVHRSGLISPKVADDIRLKTKVVDTFAKNSLKMLEKVRSLSPRNQ
jgi:hypothetical protein